MATFIFTILCLLLSFLPSSIYSDMFFIHTILSLQRITTTKSLELAEPSESLTSPRTHFFWPYCTAIQKHKQIPKLLLFFLKSSEFSPGSPGHIPFMFPGLSSGRQLDSGIPGPTSPSPTTLQQCGDSASLPVGGTHPYSPFSALKVSILELVEGLLHLKVASLCQKGKPDNICVCVLLQCHFWIHIKIQRLKWKLNNFSPEQLKTQKLNFRGELGFL